MAAALGLHAVDRPVVILERHREARAAGNILNLWPPPLRALREMGVDTTDIGAPNHTTFRSASAVGSAARRQRAPSSPAVMRRIADLVFPDARFVSNLVPAATWWPERDRR